MGGSSRSLRGTPRAVRCWSIPESVQGAWQDVWGVQKKAKLLFSDGETADTQGANNDNKHEKSGSIRKGGSISWLAADCSMPRSSARSRLAISAGLGQRGRQSDWQASTGLKIFWEKPCCE